MESADIVLVEGVSRRYEIYSRASDILAEFFLRRPRHDVVWALRDITFALKKGQRLGVIGPNGSGKSTLLKIIVGHIPPTAGRVTAHGRISAILSQSWVFNPDVSGIENIRFNLLVNGCPKAMINDAVDDIVDFTELGPFMYHPVKTYSAGMNARLAFAISTVVQPEILVIDEVLSVGDAYFMGKAVKRMVDVCDRGQALIFVSHDLPAVQRLCDVVLWLDQGMIRAFGPAAAVLEHYEADYRAREDHLTRAGHVGRATRRPEPDEVESPDLHRFRLVPLGSSKHLADTHCVRRIEVREGGEHHRAIEVGMDDVFSPEKGFGVEARGNQWGRSYERAGFPCRLLFAQAGCREGGEFVLRRELDCDREVSLSCETTSFKHTQSLGIEYLDVGCSEWIPALKTERVPLPGGWERVSATVTLRHLDELSFWDGLRRLRERERPEVEIQKTELLVKGRAVLVVKEREAFDIAVTIRARKRTACASVGIKIIRADGTYAFWQPSGWGGNNLVDLEGDATVTFHFTENCFAGGDYTLTAYCSNGWYLERNYPYTEVFDRKVGLLSFSVQREFAELDFGQINMRVPVTCVRGDHGVR